MRIEILTIGDEILSGRTSDTNFQFLARKLARVGLQPYWHTTVPDHREVLGEAVRLAIARADVVLCTGGLGATPDDLTRRVLSQVLGRTLILNDQVWAEIQAKYESFGRTAPASAQAVALVPQGAEIVPNPVGIAPGLMLPTDRGWICALPGVPCEMETQVERFLLPYLERRMGDVAGWELVLRTAGVSETAIAEQVGSEVPEGVEVAYLPNYGGVDLRLVRRASAAITRPQFDAWVQKVESRLGNVVYATGDDSLEEVVGRLLVDGALCVGVAESLTGGAIGAALTRVPGSSRYFLGGVAAYDDEVKRGVLRVSRATLENHGAVSAQTAVEMAVGVRRLLGVDVAVSSTGVAGPGGGSVEKPVGLVYLGVSTPQGETHVKRFFPGTRAAVVTRAVSSALHLLYKYLCGVPVNALSSGGVAATARPRSSGRDRARGPVEGDAALEGEGPFRGKDPA